MFLLASLIVFKFSDMLGRSKYGIPYGPTGAT